MTPRQPDDLTAAIRRAERSPVAARIPDSIRPMLATEAPEPFDSPDHVFELMWGGIRCMAYVAGGTVRLRSRNGCDLAPYFPELAAIPDCLHASDAIIDGEIVAVDAQGHPAFDLLRPRLQVMAEALAARPGESQAPPEFRVKPVAGSLVFQAVDIPWLDGRSLVERPLWQRKNRLHEVTIPAAEFAPVDFVDNEGIAFFDAVVQRRLDGIVAKRKASPYLPGERSNAWLEIRALQAGDFVIGGYTFGGARRKGEPFSQLLLGGYADGRFEHVGAVSGGLPDADARRLVAHLEPLLVERSPFFDTPDIPRLIQWVKPAVVCRVRFSEWTADAHLRFPIFSALRPDLDPVECLV